jgi:hypothetical protein
MGRPLQRIVVARYKADIGWLSRFPGWTHTVIQKQTEELEGDMPNAGREPAAFLFAIAKYYDTILPDDIWVFVQDHPFDHCPDLEVLVRQSFTEFKWLGGHSLKLSDGEGKQDHPNLPVAEYYEKWTGKPWHEGKEVSFAPGGQFMVTGEVLLQHPREYYVELMDDVTPAYNAWCAERLWESIFMV